MSTTINKPRSCSYVACVKVTDDDVDLMVGKIYRIHKSEKNDSSDMVRIVDDSGEDYLYPVEWFVPMVVPPRLRKALAGKV